MTIIYPSRRAYENSRSAGTDCAPERLGRLLSRQVGLVAQVPQSPGWAARLTRREAEAARLVGCGCTNREIAAALHVTADTVKKHVKAACRKAGAANRAELAARMAGPGASIPRPG
jgi:DNA-binding NarL/FixJ family response regulator